MYQNLKDYSAILYMNPISQAGNLPASPFPDLMPLFGLNVPFFDMYENMKASDSSFIGMFGFISANHNSAKKAMSCFIAGFVLFLVLGILAYVLWKMG